MRTPTPSKEVEAPARSTRTRIRALNPESRRLPLVHPLARLPSVTWLTCSLELGIVTITTPVVAPTPTALTHHAHAHAMPLPPIRRRRQRLMTGTL